MRFGNPVTAPATVNEFVGLQATAHNAWEGDQLGVQPLMSPETGLVANLLSNTSGKTWGERK